MKRVADRRSFLAGVGGMLALAALSDEVAACHTAAVDSEVEEILRSIDIDPDLPVADLLRFAQGKT